MIKRLAHICIHTNNLRQTEDFYCNALGMGRHFDFEKDGDLFGFYLKVGNGTFIEVFKGDPGETGNIHHLAIEVDNIDEAIARIKASGYKTGDKSFGADDAWQVWLEDPNGVKIELQQYTPASCQATRRNCQVNW